MKWLINSRNLFLMVLEAGSPRSSHLQDLVSGEITLSCNRDLLKAAPYMTERKGRCVKALISFRRAPPSRPKPVPKTPPQCEILSHWALGFNIGILQGHKHSTYSGPRFYFLWHPSSYLAHQIRSVTQLCPTLCNPMNHSTPGLPVHHQLPEFTETHVHRVSDAIQPSHPLSSPSPLAPNPSQHQRLFQWVNSSHEVAKVLELQL